MYNPDESIEFPAKAAAEHRYDDFSILLHWVTVVLVASLWTLGQSLSFFPKGGPREAALSVHILLGITLGAILLVRIAWRAGAGRRLPPADSGWQGELARSVHYGLYVLLGVTVALGLSRVWLYGNHVFDWFAFPRPAFSTRSVIRTIGGLHADLADLVVIVAGLHAAAALAHHYVLRDSVLRRMLPGKRKTRPEQ
jgi:cytochrome b561